MGGQMQLAMNIKEAREAAKSAGTDSQDTQAGGIKQSLKQNVTNNMVPEGSSNAHSDGTIMSGRFQQCKTGKKKY